MIWILSTTLFEIPTGAIADLLGKKKTLILSFFFDAVGIAVMGLAPSFSILLLSSFILAIGRSLYSGTMEALVYDSLKQEKKEDRYKHVVSRLRSVQLVSWGIASIIGGFIYVIKPQFPFFAGSAMYIAGFFLSFLLVEPRIDTEKFNFKNFLFQTKQGFKQLFFNEYLKKVSLFFICFGFLFVIMYELLEDSLTIAYGFTPIQFGILAAIYYAVSAGASLVTPYAIKKFSEMKAIFLFVAIVSFTLIISPFLGMILGGLIIITRVAFNGMIDNITSIVINKHVESKYRATTLSTLYMLRNIPYMLLAFFIGSFIDIWGAKYVAFIIGVMLLMIVLFFRRVLSSPREKPV